MTPTTPAAESDRPRSRPTAWAAPQAASRGGATPPPWDPSPAAGDLSRVIGKLADAVGGGGNDGYPELEAGVRTYSPFGKGDE